MKNSGVAFRMLMILFFLTTGAQAAGRIQVHGHRGARARFPENTLPAFKYALTAGVDALELDMQVTSDGVLVVSHDSRISPILCLDEKGAKVPEPGPLIHTLTLAQVKSFDCGAVRNPRFPTQTPVPGARIPTLNEVFDLAKLPEPRAKKVLFNIETKITPEHPDETAPPAEFARKVLDAVKKHGLFSRIILQSFDPRTLVEARKLEPKVETSLLVEGTGTDLLAAAKEYRVNVVSPDFALLNPAVVESLQHAGFQVLPWTVDEQKDWDRMIALKVDGIITDDPVSLMAYLKSKSK